MGRQRTSWLLGVGWAVVVACISGSALAGEDATDTSTVCAADAGRRAAARVQARYDGIEDLSADFEQETRSVTFGGRALGDDGVKRGRVVFAKPGRMRWAYTAPERSLVVSDGSTMWIHDEEAATATRLEVTSGFLSGAALQFLFGSGELLEAFDVEAERCEGAQVALILRPRTEASYERLGLVVDAGSGDLAETSVVDLFGNVTSIRFSKVAVDESPPDALFTFEAPPGVEVIDYGAGGRGLSDW